MAFNGCVRSSAPRVTSINWHLAGSLPGYGPDTIHQGLAGPLAGLHDNTLIIGGGANFPDSMPWFGGRKKYHCDAYVFEKKGRSYEVVPGTLKLPSPVAYGATCSTARGVLYAGGENEKGQLSTVMLVRYDKISGGIIVDKLPDLPDPIANAAIVEENGNVYLGGGETPHGPSGALLFMDLKKPEVGWTLLADLPHAVSHAVLLLARDQGRTYLYLIGGRNRAAGVTSVFFASNFRFDVTDNCWEERAPLPYPISAGTGYSTGSELILFGGDRGDVFHATEELLLEISGEPDKIRKDSLTRKKNQIQREHQGFSRQILKYSISDDRWTHLGEMPFDTPVTTTALGDGDFEVLIPSGEIRAGVRTPRLLQGKLSFDKKAK